MKSSTAHPALAGAAFAPTLRGTAPGARRRALARALRDAIATVRQWRRRAYERRLLAELDERMLLDIGVDRATASHEAAKPFWQA